MNKTTLNDLFHIYALSHNNDTSAMLTDYILDSRLSRADLNNMILLELGDRQVYYNDTVVMKFAIDNWFATHRLNIKRLVDAIEAEYNPIYPKEEWEEITENLDRKEEMNKDVTHVKEYDTNEIQGYGSENTTTYNTENKIKTDTTEETGNTETNEISAYNASSYQPQARVTNSGRDDSKVESTEAKTGTDRNTLSGEDSTKMQGTVTDTEHGLDRDGKIKQDTDKNRHTWGRDVEKVSDLLEGEIRLAKFNVYEWICARLEEKICLAIF